MITREKFAICKKYNDSNSGPHLTCVLRSMFRINKKGLKICNLVTEKRKYGNLSPERYKYCSEA